MYPLLENGIDTIVCATARETRSGEWQSAARDTKRDTKGLMFKQVLAGARLDIPEFEQPKGIHRSSF